MNIGLFFGSFNPIHIGHLAIANYILEFTELERVWYVISPHNPLKDKSTLLPDHHRYQMVHRAIEDDFRFKASDVEFKLSQPSYTVNTLAVLKEKYPEHNFSLIMGMDNLNTFHKWKNFQIILEDYFIYVYPRPGVSMKVNFDTSKIKIADAPIMEISSSFIRNAIKDGKDIRYFLHPKVFEFIEEMHFYKK